MSITTDDDVLHGMPRLEGTRISVLHIYDMAVRGESDPAAVADALDISLGQVSAALAYDDDHPEEMRQWPGPSRRASRRIRWRLPRAGVYSTVKPVMRVGVSRRYAYDLIDEAVDVLDGGARS